jgi:hypothetical protein
MLIRQLIARGGPLRCGLAVPISSVTPALRRLSAMSSLGESTPSNTNQSAFAPRRAAPARRAACASAAAAALDGGAPRQLRVSHVLLPAGQEELLEELRAKVEAGEDLGELALAHSTCTSKRSLGDLGWIGRGRTVPEFEAAAFGADKGRPVTAVTQFGLHLIVVTDDRQAAAAPSPAAAAPAARAPAFWPACLLAAPGSPCALPAPADSARPPPSRNAPPARRQCR